LTSTVVLFVLSDLIDWLWPDPFWLLILSVSVSAAAGILRGFAGFGYSAIVVATLTPFVLPGPLVIALLTLELMASATVLRVTSLSVDRAWFRGILLGNLMMVPVGVMALAWLDPALLRVVISTSLLVGAGMVRSTLDRPLRTGTPLQYTTGVISGLLNGLAGSGGIVAALVMAAAGVPAAALRATIILALFWMSAYSLLWGGMLSIVSESALAIDEALRWILVLWLPMQLGMRIGGHWFEISRATNKKALVLNVLMLVALAGTIGAIARLAHQL
jgi:uncharacterized membrane protein YfcA